MNMKLFLNRTNNKRTYEATQIETYFLFPINLFSIQQLKSTSMPYMSVEVKDCFTNITEI